MSRPLVRQTASPVAINRPRVEPTELFGPAETHPRRLIHTSELSLGSIRETLYGGMVMAGMVFNGVRRSPLSSRFKRTLSR
jgi:hypothetical protein